MNATLVLVPRTLPAPALPAGAMLVHFHTAFDAVISLRATDAPAVLVTDGLDAEDLDSLAAAIRQRKPGSCVEVRMKKWDGMWQSPVSAACRGVISGFGSAGIERAVAWLGK